MKLFAWHKRKPTFHIKNGQPSAFSYIYFNVFVSRDYLALVFLLAEYI
jgi:hypothetical protein